MVGVSVAVVVVVVMVVELGVIDVGGGFEALESMFS